jgi:hypothetical protein
VAPGPVWQDQPPCGVPAGVARGEPCSRSSSGRQQRADRARKTGLWRLTRLFSPVGWTYRNQAAVYRLYRTQLVGLADPQQQRVFPAKVDAVLSAPRNKNFSASRAYAVGLTREFARVQTGLNQVVLACALERYRQETGQYPETLDKLWPRYLDRLPGDPCTGGMLRYRRPSSRVFVLYSVGWNEQDDAGISRNDLDWVWNYPK